MGLLTLAASATGIIAAGFGLGVRPLLVRQIAIDRAEAWPLIRASFVLRAALALPALAAVVLFTRLSAFTPEQTIAVYLGYAVAIICLLYEPVQAALQAVERMKFLAYGDVITKTGVSLGGAGLVFLGFHATGLLGLSVAAVAVALVLHVFWLHRHFEVDWKPSVARVGWLAMASLPYWSFALFFTFYLWIDSLMLAVMTSSTVVGWYGLPTRLFQTLMFAPVILSTAFLPALVKAFKEGTDRLWRAARGPLEMTIVLSLPVGAGIALVARHLITLLYGRSFSQSVPVLVILGMCVPAMYLNIMVNQVLIAANRQAFWTKVMALATVVNPILNLFLIRYFQDHWWNGAIGAALALLLTEMLIAGIGILVVRRAFTPSSFLRLARAGAAAAGMSGCVLLAARFGLAAEVLAGAIAFPLLAIVLRVLTREEQRQLRGLAVRLSLRLRGART